MSDQYIYKSQTRECKHCSGTGKTTISWDEYTDMIVSDRLKSLIEENKITVEILAQKSGVDLSHIREGIAGSYRLTLSELYKLADGLNAMLKDLLPIG